MNPSKFEIFRALASSRLRHARGKVRNEDGVAAVEFALILPLLLALALGVAQVGAAIVIKTKVRTAASTMGLIASQYQSIANSDMNLILGAASVTISPYTVAPLTATISQVTVNSAGNGIVNWSDSFQGTPRGVGSSVSVPAGLATNGSVYLLAETNYNYTPAVGTAFISNLALSDLTYQAPRSGSAITRVP